MQWVFILIHPSGEPSSISTLARLQRDIEIVMHEGESLEWVPSDMRIFGEPNCDKEIDAISLFCKTHKMNFTVIPAG